MQHSQQDIEQVFQVNVYSQFWTLQEFLPDFLEQKKGHIVSMSSTAGLTGTPNLTAYWYVLFIKYFCKCTKMIHNYKIKLRHYVRSIKSSYYLS
jgi:NADP-dependent 3-hydroxy acid dehydrogenase YdfG